MEIGNFTAQSIEYYLEDAVWLSQHLSDINPPDAEARDDLSVGDYVKLMFRFGPEESDRENNECERIWVRITSRDDDGCYFGTIENDPHHDSAKFGDKISFHPLHVADINTDQVSFLRHRHVNCSAPWRSQAFAAYGFVTSVFCVVILSSVVLKLTGMYSHFAWMYVLALPIGFTAFTLSAFAPSKRSFY